MRTKLNIGLFGFGVVGTGLYEVLNKSALLDATISKIVVKDPDKKRSISSEHFSIDRNSILDDESINVVVELINDSEAAYEIVKGALVKGKHVVSANKKLIAEHLDELIRLAQTNNVSFLYEAAVAGSIPIIRNLEEYYNNDALSSICGIVNGTTNYILTQANKGIGYSKALKQAQELGFAESDPTLDVNGFDSKYKLVLLIKHAFGISLPQQQVFNYGIQHLKEQDVRFAQEKGYRIKLFSRAEKLADSVAGFVAPHFIQPGHDAFEVNNEFNAVIVEALFSDKQLFIGKGAGSFPTASAVLSDISALQFDYKYEYRRSDSKNTLDYTEDFLLKVYVGSEYIEAINEVPFYRVDEVYQGGDYNYQTGWVNFKDLRELKWNSINYLSLVVLPEPLLDLSEATKTLKRTRLIEEVEAR